MQVTEVRIKLMEGSEDRLRAFCSITLDHSFVVRDLKVIDGSGGPFVAMPSRKLSGHCSKCHYKNHLRAGYCNQCGSRLKQAVASETPQKLYADVAHPVNSECREMISSAVLAEFHAELSRASEPGYRSRYDDDFESLSETSDDLFVPEAAAESWQKPIFDEEGEVGIRIDSPHRTVAVSHSDTAVAQPQSPRPLPPENHQQQRTPGGLPAPGRGNASDADEGGFGAGVF